MTEETRRELEAAIEARKELGRSYEDQLVESFLDKIDRELERRGNRSADFPPKHVQGPGVLVGSIAVGIPVTAIALSNAPGAGGVIVAIVAWIAIAIANVAFWRR